MVTFAEGDWRPDLADRAVCRSLAPRSAPYFNLISYCRHIGLQVRSPESARWVARVRTREGRYSQKVLLPAWWKETDLSTYEEAVEEATRWFELPETMKRASEPYPVGSQRNLSICPIGEDYTVGHALEDYLAWKRIAATRSHYETIVSLINYYLVPSLSGCVLAEFGSGLFHKLALDVIETAPRRGRQPSGTRRKLSELSDEDLRKRKKTFNALVSVLRGAFQLAWDNSKIEHDRPIRCLKRLPNVDRPRVIYLDRGECRRLLAACDPDLAVLVKAALYTGCRARELTTIRVQDVLVGRGCIHVAVPKGHRPRYVFLPKEGAKFFEEHAAARPSADLLFRKRNGRAWGDEYKTYFRVARERASLPTVLTFHGLRHTYASQLIESGASYGGVAAQLGHADIRTVSSTYGHLTSSVRLREVQRHFEAMEESAGVSPSSKAARCSYRLLPMASISWPRANHSKFDGPLLDRLRSFAS